MLLLPTGEVTVLPAAPVLAALVSSREEADLVGFCWRRVMPATGAVAWEGDVGADRVGGGWVSDWGADIQIRKFKRSKSFSKNGLRDATLSMASPQ